MDDERIDTTAEISERMIYKKIDGGNYYGAFSYLISCNQGLFKRITDRNPSLVQDLTAKLRGE